VLPRTKAERPREMGKLDEPPRPLDARGGQARHGGLMRGATGSGILSLAALDLRTIRGAHRNRRRGGRGH
jgi:hypothetical protein